MLGEKQALGHMGKEKNPVTVKSHSYVPYNRQVIGQGYLGNTGDA